MLRKSCDVVQECRRGSNGSGSSGEGEYRSVSEEAGAERLQCREPSQRKEARDKEQTSKSEDDRESERESPRARYERCVGALASSCGTKVCAF